MDRPLDDKVRAVFTRRVHKRSIFEVSAFWQRIIFSGRGVPPPVKESDPEVLQFVQHDVAAIGYVSMKAATDGVRVLEITAE